MKKIVLFILATTIYILSVSCSSNDSSKASPTIPFIQQASTKYTDIRKESQGNFLLAVNPNNLKELEKNADYIVLGKLSDDSKQVPVMNSLGDIAFEYTISSFEISKVWKGNRKVGDTIKLCESYYITEKNGEPILRYASNYLPSDINRDYIFFLNSMDLENDTVYTPTIYEKGRYPFPSNISTNKNTTKSTFDLDSVTNEELNLADREATIYKSIYKEVLQKYIS